MSGLRVRGAGSLDDVRKRPTGSASSLVSNQHLVWAPTCRCPRILTRDNGPGWGRLRPQRMRIHSVPVDPRVLAGPARLDPVFVTNEDLDDLATFMGTTTREACLDRLHSYSVTELAEAWRRAEPETPSVRRLAQRARYLLWRATGLWLAVVSRGQAIRAEHTFGRSGNLPLVASAGARQVDMDGAWAPPEVLRPECAVECGG